MAPYRTLSPAEKSWIPGPAFPGRASIALVLAYGLSCAAIWCFSAAVWTWGCLLAAVLLHAGTWLTLRGWSKRPATQRRRLAVMRRWCTPGKAAGACDSQAERRLEEAFRRAGLVVHQQQVVEHSFGQGHAYRADFVYFEPQLGLSIDIEVDGEFKFTDPHQLRRMEQRDAWFTATGWHVIRFCASDCRSEPQACVQSVLAYIADARRLHARVLDEEFGSLWRGDAQPEASAKVGQGTLELGLRVPSRAFADRL